jgi:signal transduction histidine kinase
MMRPACRRFYDGPMHRPVAAHLWNRLRERSELIHAGFPWSFVVLTDVTMALICLVATLQRPRSDLDVALIAVALAVSPLVLFFVSGFRDRPGVMFNPGVMWAAWSAAGSVFLFATSAPHTSDFAPLLLVLMVGVVGSLSTLVGGFLSAVTAAGMVLAAAAMNRLDAVALYLSFIGMGWLVGFLLRTQQQLMIKQDEARAALAQHAVADERRRIAREVHDVIAHSLSVTLLHVTGARRALQQDRDVEDAVEALEQAEKLGREAMGDIRRTVGLLDDAPMRTAPEPGVDDIADLIDGFARAGLAVTFRNEGLTHSVSPGTGLALYRITQESLANVAKHAPDSKAHVTLTYSRSSATLSIVNEAPVPVGASPEGRGVRGMRQRIALLGGTIEIGPCDDGWSVRAAVPLDGESTRGFRSPCGS